MNSGVVLNGVHIMSIISKTPDFKVQYQVGWCSGNAVGLNARVLGSSLGRSINYPGPRCLVHHSPTRQPSG
jgi:hypothetical protein